MEKVIPFLGLTMVFLFGSAALHGAGRQATDETASSISTIVASAAERPISVDGHLDDEPWSPAEPATGFVQFEPVEGDPAAMQTYVRVLYDNEYLYIGAELNDDDPDSILESLGRRDDYNLADWFLVSIDSKLDRRTAFVFGVNAAGVQFDALRDDLGGGGGVPGGGGGGFNSTAPQGTDPSWDAIWDSAVRTTSTGWLVEMRIPYSMLRFPEAEQQTWGIHFSRRIPRLGEASEWPLVPRVNRDNMVANFGTVTGIEGISPKRNIQVTPYTVSGLYAEEDPKISDTALRSTDLDIGADLKVGLGSNITLDATVNPDFGQVESDPAVLNLTAFETIYEERRPFFIEGISIFHFDSGPGNLLYTRRIGADSPILGASKLSGRTAGDLSFGLLAATTGDDFSPDRHFGVARASQQIGEYSHAGAMLTLFDGPTNDGSFRRSSIVGGTDWDFRFLDNRYSFTGMAAFTRQMSSSPDEESETGVAGRIEAVKRQGAWKGFFQANAFSDTFDPNDIGRLRQNNIANVILRFEHDIFGGRSFGPFLRGSLESMTRQMLAYTDGLDLGMEIDMSTTLTLRGFQQVQVEGTVVNPFGGYDIYETRGLGPWARPAAFGIEAEMTTDERRTWRVEPEISIQLDEEGGTTWGSALRGSWNVGSRVSLLGNAEVEFENVVHAWSSNESFVRTEDGWYIGLESAELDVGDLDAMVNMGQSETLDGLLGVSEYVAPQSFYVPVFGKRDTRALDFTLRSDVTFTTNLSLQIYSQLFVARGEYDDYGLLLDRDAVSAYSEFPKRDRFTLSSLQSNVVLRWEYLPGSRVYFVWTHGRNADEYFNPLSKLRPPDFDRSIGGQIGDTFDIFPNNIFLVKVNYSFLN